MAEHRAPCVLSFYLGLPSVPGGKETDWCFTTNMTQELELAAGSKKKKRGGRKIHALFQQVRIVFKTHVTPESTGTC